VSAGCESRTVARGAIGGGRSTNVHVIPMTTYVCVYFGSLALALIATPIVIRMARDRGILDSPDPRKVHRKPVPRIGGLAIYIAMMGLSVPVLFLPNAIGQSFRAIAPQVATVLASGTIMLLVGLVDDIRSLRARTKLMAQLAAATLVCAAGVRIEAVSFGNGVVVSFGWLAWPLTVLWIVGITNAVNLSDGLDGLAAGIAAVACGVIAIYAMHTSNVMMAVLMLSLLGSLTGFLYFNFSPARIFMGDSGSLFLGMILGSSSVLCAAKTATLVGLALPVVALGVPIFDTFFSMLRRFLQRRSLFAPDRSHFHHRLLAMGLRQRHAVLMAYALTLAGTALGLFMLFTQGAQTVVIFGCILLLFVLVFRAVGSIRLRETIEGICRNRQISARRKQELAHFERIELHFRHASGFDQWWEAVCEAAEALDFARSRMCVQSRDGTQRELLWEKAPDDGRTPADDVVRLTIPIRDRRGSGPASLQIEVNANGSLESAGHRLTLFGRLAGEYPIANLRD